MAVQHLIDLCKELEESAEYLLDLNLQPGQSATYNNTFDASYHALVEGLNEIDSQDFPPDHRLEFIKQRKFLQRATVPDKLTAINKDKISLIAKIRGILGQFGVAGSRLITRDFKCIADDELKKIITRDYHELRVKLFPSGAWKSTVVQAGSILEAVLYDALTSDPGVCTKANTSKVAPCNRAIKPKAKLPTDEWTLAELINVAADIDKVPQQHANCVDEVLRGYRNFVHPRREVKSQHECGEPQAWLAIGGLDAVLDHLK